MTPNQLKNSIHNIVDVLVDKQIALLRNRVEVRQAKGARRVTWARGFCAPALTQHPFGSMPEYRSILAHQDFSALLADGAVLQMSYDIEGDEVCGHRLVYYPCPYILAKEDLEEFPIVEVLDLADRSPDLRRLRGPIRFDYSIKEGSGISPAHVHLSDSECRCPVVAPLMPGQFLRFVFANFYPQLWRAVPYLRELPRGLLDRSMLNEHALDLHFSCGR
jgi:hypothetical protein